MFKKGEHQIARVEVISLLYDGLVLKTVIKLSDINKVEFINKQQNR